MADLLNIKAAVKRQTSPGTLLVLVCIFFTFGPRMWDTFMGEPWINNTLAVVENSSGSIVVEDLTYTNDLVHGLRANTVESDDGSILCSVEHHNSWEGERKRYWLFPAFTDCNQPSEAYRVCSRFSISSASGRSRWFGPFCSALVSPNPA